MSEPAVSAPPLVPAPRRSRFRVMTLIVVVACCASLLWAWRAIRDTDEAVPLARSLRYGDPPARRGAAEGFARLPSDRIDLVVANLIPALKDADPTVREAAAVALCDFLLIAAILRKGQDADRIDDAATALTELIWDRDSRARRAASYALVRLGRLRKLIPDYDGPNRELILAALAEAQRATDGGVRFAAASALDAGAWADERAVALLLRAARDPLPGVRAAAVKSLAPARASGSEVTEALVQALRDPVPEVRDAAVVSLSTGAEGRMAGLERAASALSPHVLPPADVVPILVEVLTTADRATVVLGYRVLEEMGPEASEAVPTLLKRALGTGWDRFLAAGSVGVIAPDTPEAGRVVAHLVGLLESDGRDERFHAVDTLGSFLWDDAVAVPTLRAVAAGNDDLLRPRAVWVLEELARTPPGQRPKSPTRTPPKPASV